MHFEKLIRATQRTLTRLHKLQDEIDLLVACTDAQSVEKRLTIVWETRRDLDILALFKDSALLVVSKDELELCGIIFDMEILARSVIRKALTGVRAREPTLYGRFLHPALVAYLNAPHGRNEVTKCDILCN